MLEWAKILPVGKVWLDGLDLHWIRLHGLGVH